MSSGLSAPVTSTTTRCVRACQQHDHELLAAAAARQLREMTQDLLAAGATTGVLRGDIAPDELASFCLHALTAAATLPSTAAVRRLVTVTRTALQPR